MKLLISDLLWLMMIVGACTAVTSNCSKMWKKVADAKQPSIMSTVIRGVGIGVPVTLGALAPLFFDARRSGGTEGESAKTISSQWGNAKASAFVLFGILYAFTSEYFAGQIDSKGTLRLMAEFCGTIAGVATAASATGLVVVAYARSRVAD